MTDGWSIWIILIVAINIGGSAWLLWWTAKRRPGDPPADATSHHWDGDLTEYNKPLPMWWINLFWLTIVFALAYLAWFPGLGNFAGAGGWSSRKQLALETAQADKVLAASFTGLAGTPLETLAGDAHATATGKRIFLANCAMCHGSDARGGKGFPDLTDDSWQWGGAPNQVLATVLDGRHAQMPPLAAALGSESTITATAVYVQGLSGQPVSQALAKPGRATFDGLCAACHGPAGKGNPQLGAPDLTDDYWLYGDSFDAITDAIRNGHGGQMPAHRAILGENRAKLVAAYVYSLSHGAGAAGAR
jgi:cytochrome c oxidase cbb3-type subunit 3